MEEIKVSVLVTFYNQKELVDRAIESIINQKCSFAYEIIIGDDGSTDGTLNVIKNWMKKYPDIISCHVMERDGAKQIGGFRASRNRLNLLKYVKGTYFIFLDGDDYFSDNNKLEEQVSILDNGQNSDCVACAHDIEVMYPDGRKERHNASVKEGKYNVKQYWKFLYFHTDTLLVRSAVIKSIPVEYVINNFNDNMITYLVIQNGNIYYIPKAMAVYYQTGDGIWTGERKVVSHIRNMFLYDICVSVNPKLSNESGMRFYSSWSELYRMRKSIDATVLKPYLEEATSKGFRYSQMWLQYNSLSIFSKLKLRLKKDSIAAYRFCTKAVNKILR